MQITATIYKGVRFKRKSHRFGKRKWKVAVVGYCAAGIAGLFALNVIYQVIRKPGEVLAPFSASFAKSPVATWRSYGALFEEHSTNIISAEFLAALAQVESDGNPIASTYWRWQWSWNFFDIYRPASSAVGMFQITDGTFTEARRYCIHDHKVVAEGPWHDPNSCWFNSLYTRSVPSHAVEMTAAYLHRGVAGTLAALPGVKTSPAQKQKLAAVIHLCGLSRGKKFAARGFRPAPGERCGAHSLQRYLIKIEQMKKRFAQQRGT